MEPIWDKLHKAAIEVLQPREVSMMIEAGGVAAAVESVSGKIYVGVCIDTACTLGVCAERNAMFHMITCGENAIRRVIAIDRDGNAIPPCGACREFMTQLSRLKLKGLPSYKLGYLTDYFSIALNDAHRAWCDAEATANLYLKLQTV